MAAQVGMCCSESAQWAANHLQIGLREITPGLEKCTRSNYSCQWHHCLIPPQWCVLLLWTKIGLWAFFTPKKVKLIDLLPLPFVSIWAVLSVVTSSLCAIWGCVFVHTVWVAWPLGVCMCVSVCVCVFVFMIQQLGRPEYISLYRGKTCLRDLTPWPLRILLPVFLLILREVASLCVCRACFKRYSDVEASALQAKVKRTHLDPSPAVVFLSALYLSYLNKSSLVEVGVL